MYWIPDKILLRFEEFRKKREIKPAQTLEHKIIPEIKVIIFVLT